MWLLDVDISKATCKILVDHGHDAITLIELGIRRLKDDEVLAKAKEMTRILLSHDREFIWRTRGSHPGVVVFRVHPSIDEKVIPLLKRFLQEYNPKEIPNKLIIIEESRIIIRKT